MLFRSNSRLEKEASEGGREGGSREWKKFMQATAAAVRCDGGSRNSSTQMFENTQNFTINSHLPHSPLNMILQYMCFLLVISQF